MRTRPDSTGPEPADGGRLGTLRVRLVAIIAVALVVVAAGAVAVLRLFPRTPELGACREAGTVPALRTVPARPAGVPEESQPAVVVRVVDGDGVCVQPTGPGPLPEGRVAEVRLIGVNAPGKGVCGSDRAAAFARSRIGEGTAVWLAADEQDRDRYGRFLRYVWETTAPQAAPDSRHESFNVVAVREGYARALPKPPNEQYADEIAKAEAEARHRGTGVWRCLPWRFLRWLPVRS